MSAYTEGFEAGSRTAKFADSGADRRCPYVTETINARQWQRGYDDGASGRPENPGPLRKAKDRNRAS